MTKLAILVDGGYFLKRLHAFISKDNLKNTDFVVSAIHKLVKSHLCIQNKIVGEVNHLSLLYRTFYYDAKPYMGKEHHPISKKSINYANTDEAKFRNKLFDDLRQMQNVTVRLGEVRRQQGWVLNECTQKKLLKGDIDISKLSDDDFILGLRQKAVDMRIGIDISSLSLKKQVSTIILVAGDADFIPALSLAKREGVRIILDPLWQSVTKDLYEYIDMLENGFPKPKTKKSTEIPDK